MSQQGKVALVTGGAQGLGRAMAEQLLKEGARVCICDLNQDVGESAILELSKQYGKESVLFLQCDVTNDQVFEDCFKKTIDKFSHLDIVVNNAGIGNETDGGWRKCIQINYIAVVQGTRLGFKFMGKNNGGRGGVIVNIASITTLESWPSLPIYSSTKAAVNQYSRSVGHDVFFKDTGVKVVSLNPGMTATRLTQSEGTLKVVLHPQQFVTQFNSYYMQKPENVGRGLIEVLQKGENGSLWIVENDEPPKLMPLK